MLEEFLKILRIIFLVLPWLISLTALHQFLYNKFPKYYFKVRKVFSKWRDTNWKVSAQYSVNKNDNVFIVIEDAIKNQFGKSRKVFNLKNKKQYEFGEFSLTVQYNLIDSDADYVELEMFFGTITATLKNTHDKLRQLRLLYREIERNLNIENSNHAMKVRFTNVSNPFFGLMIQRLGEDNVKNFECEFPINIFLDKEFNRRSQNKELLVTVYTDYISINNDNFDYVEETAIKCLLME